jgi:hypothetical protein
VEGLEDEPDPAAAQVGNTPLACRQPLTLHIYVLSLRPDPFPLCKDCLGSRYSTLAG